MPMGSPCYVERGGCRAQRCEALPRQARHPTDLHPSPPLARRGAGGWVARPRRCYVGGRLRDPLPAGGDLRCALGRVRTLDPAVHPPGGLRDGAQDHRLPDAGPGLPSLRLPAVPAHRGRPSLLQVPLLPHLWQARHRSLGGRCAQRPARRAVPPPRPGGAGPSAQCAQLQPAGHPEPAVPSRDRCCTPSAAI
jgi:hypothetical protein